MTRPVPSGAKRRALLEAIGAAARTQQRAVDRFDQALVDHVGVNRTDGRCIDLIAELGPISAGDLARAAHLTTGAVTTAVDRMARAGWVRRTDDPHDRRRVLLEITEQTEGVLRDVFVPLVREGHRALERFTDEQLETILAYLELDRALQEEHADRLERRGPALG
jgi:DNA-binding MarR family transcriptional regulator